MNKYFSKLAWQDINISLREHIVLVLLVISLTPFWRGGRDPLGLLLPWGCLLLAGILILRIKGLKWSPPPAIITVLGLVFISWQLLSVFWARDSHSAIFQNLFWIGGLLSGYLALLLLANVKRRTWFIRYNLIFTSVVSVIGYVMFVNIPFDRATSLFYWPNPLALYLLLSLIFGLYEFWKNRSFLTLAFLFIISGTFLLTESLATFTYAILAAVLMYIFVGRSKRQLLDIVLIILAGVILSLTIKNANSFFGDGVSIGTPDEVSELVELKSSGVQDRFDFWQGSLAMWGDNNWLFGTGLESFPITYPNYQLDAGAAVGNPHNLYIQQGSETGAIGLGFLIVFLSASAIFIWQNRHKTEVVVGGTAILIWLLHSGFYQTNRYPTLLAWLFVSLAFVLSTGKAFKVSTKQIYIFILVVTLLLVPAYSRFNSEYHARLGNELAEVFRVDDAIEAYTNSTKPFMSDPDNYGLLGWQYYLIGEPNEAFENFDSAIRHDEFDAFPYYLKSFVFNQLNDPATETLSLQSLSRDPLNNPRAYYTYADFLIDNNRNDEAKYLLDMILEQYIPQNLKKRSGSESFSRDVALLHWLRAQIALDEGDAETAAKQIRRTLKLRPDYKPALSVEL